MLSSVLNSPQAIEMNIQIVRVFVLIRRQKLSQQDLPEKLKELEEKFNKQFNDVYEVINYLLKKDTTQKQQHDRKRIGFK